MGWGGRHSVTSHVTQSSKVVFSAVDSMFGAGISKITKLKRGLTSIQGVFGGYNNKFIEQMCNQTASLEDIYNMYIYIGLLECYTITLVTKCALIVNDTMLIMFWPQAHLSMLI